MRIKDMPADCRPRERLAASGARALSDAELLAIILQKGTPGENVVEVSNRLIAKYGVKKLPELSLAELQEIKGVGPAKAMQMAAFFELSKRCIQKDSGTILSSPEDVFEYARYRFPSQDREHFMVIHLNSKNRILRSEIVATGIINASLAHPREIFKSAIKENAYSIIITHNHPSGDPAPSQEDKAITEQLVKAGEMMGIPVLDHVVIGKENYCSILNTK